MLRKASIESGGPVQKGLRLMARAPVEDSSESQSGKERIVEFHVTHLHQEWNEDHEENGTEVTLQVDNISTPNHKIESPPQPSVVTMFKIFEWFGHVPIPPYFNRDAVEIDNTHYNNVYAGSYGSVASPTAGLHFTEDILKSLREGEEVKTSFVDLCVGAGTFQPVMVDNIRDHGMHSEEFSIEVSEMKSIIASLEAGAVMIPVGTTSVRNLETLYWCGVRRIVEKLRLTKTGPQKTESELSQPGISSESEYSHNFLFLDQWEDRKIAENFSSLANGTLPSAADAYKSLLPHASEIATLHGATRLCIVPGYKFHLVDYLFTNFHQADSTLLLLVAALIGRHRGNGVENDGAEKVRRLYEYAISNEYMFLSYGDGSLLENVNKNGQ
jgi:S-adenosylmethionine:tRNA ribosyltransferase-isomerase